MINVFGEYADSLMVASSALIVAAGIVIGVISTMFAKKYTRHRALMITFSLSIVFGVISIIAAVTTYNQSLASNMAYLALVFWALQFVFVLGSLIIFIGHLIKY